MDDKGLKFSKTERGFGIAEWNDIYGFPCELQESSIALLEQPGAGAVWLGRGDNRMHLDRTQVKMLVRMLVEWLGSGQVEEPSE